APRAAARAGPAHRPRHRAGAPDGGASPDRPRRHSGRTGTGRCAGHAVPCRVVRSRDRFRHLLSHRAPGRRAARSGAGARARRNVRSRDAAEPAALASGARLRPKDPLEQRAAVRTSPARHPLVRPLPGMPRMTWLELAPFIGLGIVSNTVFPMPFEPLLVAFGGGRTSGELVVLCLLGSLCAGAGALVDVGCLGVARRKIQRRQGPAVGPRAGIRFYLFTAAAGLLPLPFSLVRIGLLRTRPDPLLFAGIVALARYPRYLVIVFAWGALAL